MSIDVFGDSWLELMNCVYAVVMSVTELELMIKKRKWFGFYMKITGRRAVQRTRAVKRAKHNDDVDVVHRL